MTALIPLRRRAFGRVVCFVAVAAACAQLATAPLALAQPAGVPGPLAAQLDSALAAMRTARGIVGVSAAIVSGRLGSWSGAAGVADIETSAPVTTDMLFGVGSVSKTYTSALILELVAADSLSLDDTIGTWVGGFRNVDGKVSVRQLLQHTSGLYNYTDSRDFWQRVNDDFGTIMTPEEILTYVGPRSFSPGFGWQYSNTNYVLLGMIAERITGRSLEQAIEEILLAPLALERTAAGWLDTLPGPTAGNHIDTDGDGDLDNFGTWPRQALFSGAWAAGGLFATAAEVARWGNELYGGRVLTTEMQSALTTIRPVAEFGPGGGYGLGVVRASVSGRQVLGHTGGIPGYASALWHVVADDVTVAVLVNQDSDAATPIALELLRLVRLSSGAADERGAVAMRTVAQPNPFSRATTIGFETERRGAATVRVFDALGRRVRTLLDAVVERGPQRLAWDGRDDAGVPVGGGVYFVRVEVDGAMTVETLRRIP